MTAGAAGGDGTTQQTPPNTGGGDGAQSKPNDQGGDGTGAGKPGEGGDGKPAERTFTQAELNAQIDDRLRREREKNERESNERAAEAERKALTEQSKFKELSETLQGQLDAKATEVTTLQARLEAAEKALTSSLEGLRKDIPQHIITLLDKMTPADQLEYISTNAEQLKPPPANGSTDGSRQTSHVPNTPPPGGANLTDEERRRQSVSARQMW